MFLLSWFCIEKCMLFDTWKSLLSKGEKKNLYRRFHWVIYDSFTPFKMSDTNAFYFNRFLMFRDFATFIYYQSRFSVLRTKRLAHFCKSTSWLVDLQDFEFFFFHCLTCFNGSSINWQKKGNNHIRQNVAGKRKFWLKHSTATSALVTTISPQPFLWAIE